ncbi:MAG: hypothetical protein MZV63_24995 [Marinilabiliales bacterium]|nr:hypothetical protein [Marinilabiliales bacterium]
MGISSTYFRRTWDCQLWSDTRSCRTADDLEVIFVVPKAWGDEDQSMVRLIGANKVPVAFKKVHYKDFRRPVEKIEIFIKDCALYRS